MALSVGWFTLDRARSGARRLQSVVVSTKTGLTIRGALAERTPELMILKAASQASLNQGRVEWQAIAGDVVIPMENIDYWQAGVEPAMNVEG